MSCSQRRQHSANKISSQCVTQRFWSDQSNFISSHLSNYLLLDVALESLMNPHVALMAENPP
jgi:DNA-binding IscR family transcriptional regulator